MNKLIILTLFFNLRSGEIYFSLEDYKNAILFYSELLRNSPGDPALKAKLLLSIQAYVDKRKKEYKEIDFKKVMDYYQNGKIDSALIFSRNLFNENPFSREALILYQKLIKTADTLMKLYLKADSAENVKNFEKAYKIWKNIQEIYPYEKRAKNKLNMLASKVSTEIIKYEKKPVPKPVIEKEVSPKITEEEIKNKINALYKEGIRLYTEGKLKEAREIWIEILKIDPQNTKVKRNLAVVEERLRAKR